MRRRLGRVRGGLQSREISVKIAIPFVAEIGGVWVPVDAEREAAWELYVELATRVTVVELGEEEGLLREALSSLYTVFGTTREILRQYGPSVAPRVSPGHVTFGVLAVNVLNLSIRPLLSRWHPLLAAYEAQRADNSDPVSHERQWDRAEELRGEIENVRKVLLSLAQSLNEVAGVGDLITPRVPRQTPVTDDGN
ncbi:hypothetical protein [Streptomyces microflavus]|uniref:hypothetical protein n=1 Tax=Streptomyces microflavus TaxID=1919 RepID=UPI003863E4D0|nr:hypothetical protein OG269_00630 [Streptomyces microflavus]